VPSKTLLSPLHLCLVLVRHTDMSWGATILPYITSSTKSLLHPTHTQDRVPVVSTHREVERILQRSRAVIQEAPSGLKVSSRRPAVPREMAGDSSPRHVEGRVQGATHSGFGMLVCTHVHTDTDTSVQRGFKVIMDLHF